MTVANLNISHASVGIELWKTNGTVVRDNTLKNNSYGGIYLEHSYFNLIVNNTVVNNWGGISLAYSRNNTIQNNTVVDNGSGVHLWYSGNTTIRDNLFVGDGLYVFKSYYNTVVNNTVNGRPLAYFENASNLFISGAGQVILVHCRDVVIANSNLSHVSVGIELVGVGRWETRNVTIRNNTISHNWYGIYLRRSRGNTIVNNTITDNKWYGIYSEYSHHNLIAENVLAGNGYGGIYLYNSSGNVIESNDIMDNGLGGMYLGSSQDNVIVHNNFINNTYQAYSEGSESRWDLGYPGGGNYWSDHRCVDRHSGPRQDKLGSDGICDEPYPIKGEHGQYDRYPLASPRDGLTTKERLPTSRDSNEKSP